MNLEFTIAILIFLIAPLIFIFMEKMWPYIPNQNIFRDDGITDMLWYLCQFFISRKIVPFLLYFSLIHVVSYLGRSPQEFFNGFGPLEKISIWWQLPIALLFADFLLYWQHRFFHSRFAWPFHAIHHSSKHVYWISATRMHPINEIVAEVFVAIIMLCCGFNHIVLGLLVTILSLYSMFMHSNVPWGLGPFRYIVVSPIFHRWHHTSISEGGEKNYSAYFPIWDILFGTFYMPEGILPKKFGVADPVPNGFVGQLLYPIKKK